MDSDNVDTTTRRELIRHLHSLTPSMSGAEMARQLGCTRARVSVIMEQEFGRGTLKRFQAQDSIHINLGSELREQLAQASAGHDSISGFCRTILGLACYLSEMGIDPVVVLGMKSKDVEAMKSFESPDHQTDKGE